MALETIPIAVPLPHAEIPVRGLLDVPQGAKWLYVFAHGAGAGMSHHFMAHLSNALSERAVATLRYNFPYMEKDGRRAPDAAPILTATVRAAVVAARSAQPNLRLVAGGKSMGGRMTSLAASQDPPMNAEGIVFVGFPLHPPGRPGTKRADHLDEVSQPMLFLQGTRDRLADLDLLRPVLDRLGTRASLRLFESADHGFKPTKRSGQTPETVVHALAEAIVSWAQSLPPSPSSGGPIL